MDNESYVVIAYGHKYVEQANNLIKSIKKFDQIRKCILISNIKKNELFDEIIDIENEFVHEANNHNKYCVLARLFAPKYIKSCERFIMIDTDIVCLNDPEFMWKSLASTNNCFNCVGGRDHKVWHWNNITNINDKLGMTLNPMHGGVIYFDRSHPNFDKYMENLIFGLENYDKLGFKRLFRNNAMTDEIIFSYANSKLGITPLDFVDYPIVSFCLRSDIDVSTKIVSWGTTQTTFNTEHPTVLNHFTGLNDNNFIRLYSKWLDKLKIT